MDFIPKQSFQTVSILYGSMSLFLTIVHNIFLLYYVDMFVSVYKIDKLSFWIGEIVFLIWNSVNDPLFGWFSDRKLLQNKPSEHQHLVDVVLSRLQILAKTGPFFALSFSLFWVHWLPTSLQFVLCLCLYDGFLTCVDLQHTALMADLTIYASDRAKLNRYSSFFSTLGSSSVLLSYMFWNKQNVFSFQLFCTVIAVFSAVGFFASTQFLIMIWKKLVTEKSMYESAIQKNNNADSSSSNVFGMKKYFCQLASNSNFRWFTSMNLLQQFFPLFLDALVGDAIAPGIGPMLIETLLFLTLFNELFHSGISFVLPHINNLYFLTLCDRHGVYHVIRWLFYTKLFMALVMLCVGRGSVWMLCLFIASNRVFTEGTCKLLNLVISDMVDEDYVQHSRDRAASAVLFGTSSLLSKPGQTFAPLIGTWLLALYTGEDVFQGDLERKASDSSVHELLRWSDNNPTSWVSRREACFYLLVTVPIICSVLQLAAWSRFTLHGSRLNQIKSIRLSKTADAV